MENNKLASKGAQDGFTGNTQAETTCFPAIYKLSRQLEKTTAYFSDRAAHKNHEKRIKPNGSSAQASGMNK